MNIGIVGVGLIGGSICKALKKHNKNTCIYALDKNEKEVILAKKKKAIDYIIQSYAAFSICDVVFVAVSAEQTAQVIMAIASETGENCIITDCASVKSAVSENVNYPRYIGGHPMAGVENGGFIASREYMFENAYYVLTGNEKSSDYQIVSSLVKSMRAIPFHMSADEHDIAVSKISHLPHMVAYSLVQAALTSENARKLAAGGFKDITRIAASSPALWSGIAIDNKENIIKDIDNFIEQLESIKAFLVANEKKQLEDYFEQSRENREDIQTNIGGLNMAFTLKINISDKVGSMATILKILTKNKISIANIHVENSREGENGILSLVFFDRISKEIAEKVLRNGGVKC